MTKRVRGKERDAAFALNCWLDSPTWCDKRPSKGEMDFGDIATVGKRLKRRYLTFYEFEMSLDFGMYLGKHKDEWVVGILNDVGDHFIAAEVFNSLSELHEAWVLD